MATKSHLAGARLVRRAWQRLHGDAPFWILLADADTVDRVIGCEHLLGAHEVGLDPGELRIRRGIYTPSEYATSLKPVIVQHLLRQGADVVVFTDADTNLYAPLDSLVADASTAGACLTPHVLAPLPADGKSPDELELLKLGVLNTGLVAVSHSGMPFVDWWVQRARRDCLGLPDDGFLLDQRWVDLAPTQFGARLTTDPGLNVAFWNLHERRLRSSTDGWTVNGVPLRHFHFSGFDADEPATLTAVTLTHPHRVRLEDDADLTVLFRSYAQELVDLGHRDLRSTRYAFAATAAGRTLTQRDRLLLREAVLAHEAGAAPVPPDPFDPADASAFAELAGCSPSRLDISNSARARVTRLNRLASARGHMRLQDRLTSTATGILVRRLGLPDGPLATPSTSVFHEYR